ncbi:MAG TPA: DUF6602 domain-containing protein [Terriglobales bacterium]|nr:DUF6602 domain-containing protein [Terriglobales bacterium]
MDLSPRDGWVRLLHSWSEELLSATDRVQHLIGNNHQLTKGSYKEALLRSLLRRVLPDRFRVSTGFIYRWGDQPSRQLDVIIWDAHNHSALLEEGELAILSDESVAAVIEVKSVLNRLELRDAISLLSPPRWVNWRYTSASSRTGLLQQVPNVPFRAVFAFTGEFGKPGIARGVFEELGDFYRTQFGADAQMAMEERGGQLDWANMIDAICVADGPSIEQTHLHLDIEQGPSIATPAFAAYGRHASDANVSVGRFCMFLLRNLTGWFKAEATRMTLDDGSNLETPGVCSFGRPETTSPRMSLFGTEVPASSVWYPQPPLWNFPLRRK